MKYVRSDHCLRDFDLTMIGAWIGLSIDDAQEPL